MTDPIASPTLIPSIAPVAAASLDMVLQPGTIVTAQVLKLLDAELVRIAIGSLTLDVASTVPLQQGQAVRLAVTQTDNGVNLVPVSAGAPTSREQVATVDGPSIAPVQTNALTPAQSKAVDVATQTAAPRQASLSPLFANLTAAITSGSLPPPVLLAAARLLALRLPVDRPLSGSDIKDALTSSGLLREASLATNTGASSAQSPPDIKSALVVLRQTLATWLAPSVETTIPPQSRVPSVQQQPTPSAKAEPTATKPDVATTVAPRASSPSNVVVTPATGAVADDEVGGALKTVLKTLTEAPPDTSQRQEPRTMPAAANPVVVRAGASPPFRNALPSAQPVAAPSLASDEPVVMARQLIAETDGALARQTLLQVASLPDRLDANAPRSDATQPRWNFEIPFVTPQGTAMAQFEIARDGGGRDAEASARVWRARFSVDIEPAGPVHALISFSGDTTSVKMWAERPATVAQLRANASNLSQSLDRAALRTGDIIVADGSPMGVQSPRAGHFLNRAS